MIQFASDCRLPFPKEYTPHCVMILHFTPEEMLAKGLNRLPSFDYSRLNKLCENTKLDEFRKRYGVSPGVAAAVWKDLQEGNGEGNINPRKTRVDSFFMALEFLKLYPSGSQQASTGEACRQTATKWDWYFLKQIAALKTRKIVWPSEWEPDNYAAAKEKERTDGNVYVVNFGPSVDGTHGRIHEPAVGETRSKNPLWFSHKFHGPGLAYEFALDVFTDRLVWMNGPFPASVPDSEIFKNSLIQKIPKGMRVIADRCYQGEPLAHIISGLNPHDNKALARFKSRAKSRQEGFNTKLKQFKICAEVFRHDKNRLEKHKISWTAAAVMVQYGMELDNCFWDV